jgi:hypothetical protein
VQRGWQIAFARMPESVAALLRCPAGTLAHRCEGLPRTLTLGEMRFSNFAVMPDERVASVSWGAVGAGPATLDLGRCLAANSMRLRGTKEDSIARYRNLLESERGAPFTDCQWEEMVSVGILGGALALIWAKALELETGTRRAREEWDWWVDRLASV